MDALDRSIGARLATAITRHPIRAIIVGLLAMAAIFTGFSRITANFTHTSFFYADDPALVRFNAFERRFGNDDAVAIVVHSPSGVFDRETATLLQTLTQRMWKVPEVIRVDSLANFNWVHADGDDIKVEPLIPDDQPLTEELLAARAKVALGHETIPDYLVSRDGKTALVYARIKPGIDAPPNAQLIVAETRKVLAELQGGDHAFHLTGGPVINDAFRDSSQNDLQKLVPVLLLMVGVFLFVSLRRLGGLVLPFIVIGFSAAGSVALGGLLGIELTSITFVIPEVMIAVCVSDSVHVLASFYRARKQGMTRRAAAQHTLAKNFLPTLLTSVTTAAGFFSFATANLKPVSGFGVLAGTGTMLAWLLTYFVLGPLMVLWPGREPTSHGSEADEPLEVATPRSRAFVGFVERWRRAILAVFAMATIAAVVVSTRNTVNSDPYKYFRAGYPMRDAQDFILTHLNGVAGFEIVVEAGREDGVKDPAFLRKVEAFEKRATSIPGITKTVSLVDVIRQTNRSLHGDDPAFYKVPDDRETVAQELFLYTMSLPQGMDVNDRITIKNDALRVSLIGTITDSTTAVATAGELENMATEMGLKAHVTGKMMLYQSMNGHVVNSFIQSLAIAIVLIGLIMLVSFRSLKLGLVSMIPNVVPLVLGGALLKFLDHPLDIGTVMVASICLGIAVDNTIHIMTHYTRHTRAGMTGRQALESLIGHTGPAMVITTLILVAGFSVLAFGTFIPNVYFGIMTASILSVGLVADLLLLPALLFVVPVSTARAPSPATADARAAGSALAGG